MGGHWNALEHISRHIFKLRNETAHGTALTLICRKTFENLSKFHAIVVAWASKTVKSLTKYFHKIKIEWLTKTEPIFA